MTRMVGGAFLDLDRVVYGDLRAGELVNNLQVLYLDGTFWRPSSPQTTATVPARGMAIQSAASGAIVEVMTYGIASNSAWALASGLVAFLGSGGNVIASAPTGSGNWVQRLGVALYVNVIDFRPEIRPVQVGE